jgi:hypothetical protein
MKLSAETEGVGKKGDLAPQPPREVVNNRSEGNDNEGAGDFCYIRLPKRTEISPVVDTWWMVDLHAHPAPTQGATPLVKRCMRELGWNEANARAVLRAYR